jgi:hypothetical protein
MCFAFPPIWAGLFTLEAIVRNAARIKLAGPLPPSSGRYLSDNLTVLRLRQSVGSESEPGVPPSQASLF